MSHLILQDCGLYKLYSIIDNYTVACVEVGKLHCLLGRHAFMHCDKHVQVIREQIINHVRHTNGL